MILLLLLLIFLLILELGFWKKIWKKKTLPIISPKKTINGAIGGSICQLLLRQVSHISLGKLSLPIIFILVLSCFAQLGDLIESKLKRQLEIKG